MMKKRTISPLRSCLLGFTALSLLKITAASEQPIPPDAKTVIASIDSRRDAVMRLQLAKPYPPSGCSHYQDFALAAYWLNQRTKDADKAILTEREKEFPESLKGGDFHWNAYILERIYFLFGRGSKHFPGRMSVEAEAALLEMLWQWAAPNCRLEMTLPERDWWRWGSENHHAQAWSSFWGAAQIFAKHPDYKNRRYADGTTPAQMAVAFNDYYKRFIRNTAASGLLVECNSAYNKYTLGGWYNIADFADDPKLRRRMSMLLDLYWADWAIEEINGVRGGSRHRCYPGGNSTTSTSMDGLAWFHFGLGSARSQHPSCVCGATTFWRPSPLVAALALDAAGRGVYESISRRPGLAVARKAGDPPPNFVADPKHPFFAPQGVYALRPEGGSLLRYSYCTPDFVMGTSMIEARDQKDWTAISSQNRWEGVIFAGHPTARIFSQPLEPKRGSVYNAEWSVQKRGVLIVQRLKSSNAKGQRVWFDASLKRQERSGWVFAEAPRAYAAVRVVKGEKSWEKDTIEQHRERKGRTDGGEWLKCADEYSPVIIEAARKADFKDFTAFQTAVLGNTLKYTDRRLDYASSLNRTTLTLFPDYSKSPLVDGVQVNYAPKKVHDSSFIQGDFGSGIVTIRKGDQELVLDFN